MADRPNGDRRLAVQHEITLRLLHRSDTLTDTLRFIVSKIRTEIDAEHVDIIFSYSDHMRVEISSDLIEEGRHVPLDSSLSGLALLGGRTILENDVASDNVLSGRYLHRRPDADSPTPRGLSVIVSPIELQGERVGVVNVEAQGTTFTQEDADLVAAVTAQISLAVDHASLFDEEELRSETDRLLLEDTSTDNELVVRRALDNVLAALRTSGFIRAEAAEVLFLDPGNTDVLRVAYSTNADAIGLRVDVRDSICGRAFRERRPIRVRRPGEDRTYRPLQDGMRSELAVPIQLGGNRIFSIGVLNIESSEENAFNDVAEMLAERFARRVVFMLALSKLRADVDDAMHDQLLVNAADQVLNAIHRINNHLGAVRVLAQDLRSDLARPEQIDWTETRERLLHLEQEAERSLAIPKELRRRIHQPEEVVDVNGQIREGLARLRVPPDVTLVETLQRDLPDIPCTALDLTIENLVQNALDALRPDGGTVELRSRVDSQPDGATFVVIQVADDGRGMTDDMREKLFDRRKATYRGRGLGFGMPWVKTWVSRANGLIDVQSEVGAGTTVTIRFQIETHPGGTLPPPERSIE